MTQINPEDVRVGDRVKIVRTFGDTTISWELTVTSTREYPRGSVTISGNDHAVHISCRLAEEYTVTLLSRPIEDAIYIDLSSGFTWRASSDGKIIFSDMVQQIRSAFNDVKTLEEGVAKGRLAKVVLR